MAGSVTWDHRGLEELERRLQRASAFDLTTPGEAGEPVGREARNEAGRALLDRFLDQRGPSGRAWKPLNRAYRSWKARSGYPTRIGVLTGESSQERQFLGGRTIIEPTSVTFSYGTSAYSKRVMKHFHFGTRRQPERPFWVADGAVSRRVRGVLRAAIRRHLARAIRGGG